MKKTKIDKVDEMRVGINSIVRYDAYVRVAAYLWDKGIRSSSMSGKNTLAHELCKSGRRAAVQSPYITNAFNHLRYWELGINSPEVGQSAPLDSIPRI